MTYKEYKKAALAGNPELRKEYEALAPQGQLIYNAELDRYELDGVGLHCGSCLKVLVYNGKEMEWRETRIEKADDWYLVGLNRYQLNGLFAEMV